jgi:hypothetical protein
MIREKSKKQNQPIIIDLTGPQGNAFFILGMANDFAKQLGWTRKDRDKLQEDMKSSDYENLIRVFDKHFWQLCNIRKIT